MDEHVIKTYRRATPVFVKGEGATLFTEGGESYLDFLGGIAVSALGHAHPQLVEALRDQVGAMLHVSNLFRHPFTEEVAGRVTRLAGMSAAFFCNSGAEANEAALKIARKYHHASGRRHFVALEGGFHGRTLGALSVTHKPSFREPFGPLPEARFVPRGDAAALQDALETRPAALILEPIQGEGGVHELSADYLQFARALCTRTDTLLIHDEVQTGCGRTGRFLAAQHADVTPDIVSLAKPIAAGLPMGVTLVRDGLEQVLQPGDHGSTFAGGPLVCRAALVLLRALEEGGLQERVREVGDYFGARLAALPGTVRGRGLMRALGLPAGVDAFALQTQLFERGLIVNATDASSLRLLPPYVVTEAEIDRAVALIGDALS